MMNEKDKTLRTEHSSFSTNNSSLKVPAIRFKGFSGAWEERTLGEVGELKNGMNFSKEAMGHGYPFVNLQDVFGKNVVSNNGLGFAVSTATQRKDYSLQKGDVLFIRSSVKPEGVGEAAVIYKNFENTTYSGFIIRFRPKLEMAVNFSRFIYSITYIRKQILASATSSANTNINQESLQKIQLALPEFFEQTKIGNYFQQLDTLISQHQQKHDKLLNLKKSLLEKMFPKQGKDEPEIRFKGFSGAWEEKEFSDTFANIPNNTLSRAELNYDFGLSKNVHYGDVLIKFGEVLDIKKEIIPFITNNNFTHKLKSTKLHDGDVIIADAAEDKTVGKCTELVNIGEEIIFSGLHTIAVRPVLPFSSKYLGYYMNSFAYHDQLLFLMQGTKVLSISKSAIQNTSINFPNCTKEQTKIGKLFKTLDTLLTQHQSQLKKLKQIKQACLAKMFV
ncbi:MAG: restriction endonuclease subunit S [Xanthomonadales bacterium]|nr:restriction endonuclease subunit S [Xanthomonadales bacterium]